MPLASPPFPRPSWPHRLDAARSGLETRVSRHERARPRVGGGAVGSRPSALCRFASRVKLPATYDITIYHTPRSTRRRSVAQPAFITHPCSSRESLTSEHLLCCEHLAPSKISGARCTVYGCSTYYCADRRGLGRRSGRAVAYEQSGYVWHTAFL